MFQWEKQGSLPLSITGLHSQEWDPASASLSIGPQERQEGFSEQGQLLFQLQHWLWHRSPVDMETLGSIHSVYTTTNKKGFVSPPD